MKISVHPILSSPNSQESEFDTTNRSHPICYLVHGHTSLGRRKKEVNWRKKYKTTKTIQPVGVSGCALSFSTSSLILQITGVCNVPLQRAANMANGAECALGE
jgi:hypothetical protein